MSSQDLFVIVLTFCHMGAFSPLQFIISSTLLSAIQKFSCSLFLVLILSKEFHYPKVRHIFP